MLKTSKKFWVIKLVMNLLWNIFIFTINEGLKDYSSLADPRGPRGTRILRPISCNVRENDKNYRLADQLLVMTPPISEMRHCKLRLCSVCPALNQDSLGNLPPLNSFYISFFLFLSFLQISSRISVNNNKTIQYFTVFGSQFHVICRRWLLHKDNSFRACSW